MDTCNITTTNSIATPQDVASGLVQLRKGEYWQKKSRKKMMCILILFVAIIVMIILIALKP
jgi:t-SNARE complex subunit (syntaxin)